MVINQLELEPSYTVRALLYPSLHSLCIHHSVKDVHTMQTSAQQWKVSFLVTITVKNYEGH